VKISKTLSLRIVRPYYKLEVEAAIKAEKDKREEQGQTRSLDAKFFNELKKKYPQIILNGSKGGFKIAENNEGDFIVELPLLIFGEHPRNN
jgi:hypothetical protein